MSGIVNDFDDVQIKAALMEFLVDSVEIEADSTPNSEEPVKKRRYVKMAETAGMEILHTIRMKLPANFSVVEPIPTIVKAKLEPYGIDGWEFCVRFDGASYEYFTKQLDVMIFIYEDCYSFEFTKPQWLGMPRSKDTESWLLGAALENN